MYGFLDTSRKTLFNEPKTMHRMKDATTVDRDPMHLRTVSVVTCAAHFPPARRFLLVKRIWDAFSALYYGNMPVTDIPDLGTGRIGTGDGWSSILQALYPWRAGSFVVTLKWTVPSIEVENAVDGVEARTSSTSSTAPPHNGSARRRRSQKRIGQRVDLDGGSDVDGENGIDGEKGQASSRPMGEVTRSITTSLEQWNSLIAKGNLIMLTGGVPDDDQVRKAIDEGAKGPRLGTTDGMPWRSGTFPQDLSTKFAPAAVAHTALRSGGRGFFSL
jgi:hypothetical protein